MTATMNLQRGQYDPTWRAGFAATEAIQRVRPAEFKGDLLNPHIGTTTFQRFNGDPVNQDAAWNDAAGPEQAQPYRGTLANENYPDTTISYCRWGWFHLEPKQGEYRFEFIENALKAAQERGQTLQIRVQTFVGQYGVPQWYWDAGGTGDPEKPNTRHPDHNNPLYARHFGRMITELGRRFDGHPALESVDMAVGGPCGENEGNCNAATAEKLAEAYLQAFPRTQLVGLIRNQSLQYATRKTHGRVGWRADCYGDYRDEGRGQVPNHLCWTHMIDFYPKQMVLDGITETWKTAPVTLETCWTVPHWFNKKWDIDMILEQGLKYHPSVFMPKSCFFPRQWWDKLMAFNRRLGYRLVLRQGLLPLKAKAGQMFKSEWLIDNVGVAPLYRPYQMALRFRQAEAAHVVPLREDVRKWLPDLNWFEEEITIPHQLSPGTVAVDVGIIDPATQQAKVKFAIEGVGADGWHPLTHLDVVE